METDTKGPTVFVWDLDETLIIFQTLLDGRYVELFDGFKDSHKATLLGRRWESLILEVCDDYFYYNHVEEYNYSNVNALQEYDDGADLSDFKFEDVLKPPLNADNLRNLRYLHRYISRLYEQGLDNLLTTEQAKEWRDLYEATDLFTDGWLSTGRQKLEELQKANEQTLQEIKTSRDGSVTSVSAPNSYNFLVTSGTLIPSLVKCLLFKLNPYFDASNIFSSREVGKLQCCRWIRDRFSCSEKLPKFCSIGDGPDEREAARVLAWPFVNISIDPDAPGRLPLLSYKTVKARIDAVYSDNADISKGDKHILI
jgi:EYA(Eyes Absent) family protein